MLIPIQRTWLLILLDAQDPDAEDSWTVCTEASSSSSDTMIDLGQSCT